MMKRTNFFFDEAMIERMKRAKAKSGIPLSELMRRAVDAFLKAMKL